MARAAGRMSALVTQLLDLGAGRADGAPPLHFQYAALRAVCLEAIEEQRFLHPGRSVLLEAPAEVLAEVDRARVLQLVGNLLGNALDHGSGPAVVRLRSAPEGAFLEVANGGPRIDSDDLEDLFQAFRRGHAAAPACGHMGLGLYIVREIARAHGGEAFVSSDENETRFTVRLPLRQGSTRPVRTA
jgi:signal transduction histidine kinase